MARPEKHVPKTLEEAVDELKRDPSHRLRLAVNDVEVELRLIEAETAPVTAPDVLAGIGPWKGESTREILRVLREAREADDPGERTAP